MVFTLNHLTIPPLCTVPVILMHFLFLQSPRDGTRGPAPVWVHNLQIRAWESSWDLVTWGCRYACESTDARVRWVPAHCVQPVLDGTPQSNGPGRSLPDSMEQQECLGGPVVHTEPNRILVAASLFFALATDVDSICHPTLQNCVDIDFCC